MDAVSAALLTIGYERHRTPDSLLGTLAGANVERLVDVAHRKHATR